MLQRDNIAGLKREITREITSITLKRGDAAFHSLLMEGGEDEDEEEHGDKNKNTRKITKRGAGGRRRKMVSGYFSFVN